MWSIQSHFEPKMTKPFFVRVGNAWGGTFVIHICTSPSISSKWSCFVPTWHVVFTSALFLILLPPGWSGMKNAVLKWVFSIWNSLIEVEVPTMKPKVVICLDDLVTITKVGTVSMHRGSHVFIFVTGEGCSSQYKAQDCKVCVPEARKIKEAGSESILRHFFKPFFHYFVW